MQKSNHPTHSLCILKKFSSLHLIDLSLKCLCWAYRGQRVKFSPTPALLQPLCLSSVCISGGQEGAVTRSLGGSEQSRVSICLPSVEWRPRPGTLKTKKLIWGQGWGAGGKPATYVLSWPLPQVFKFTTYQLCDLQKVTLLLWTWWSSVMVHTL